MLELLIVSPSRLLGQGLASPARKSQIRITGVSTIDDFVRTVKDGGAWGMLVIDDLCIYAWDEGIIRTAARLQSSAKRVLLAEPFLTSEVAFYLSQGLHGVLNKRAQQAEFLANCRAIAGGACVVDLPWRRGVGRDPPLRQLTVRQREILALVSAGHSNKEIAQRLGCTSNTVKAHLRTIYHVLGVHTRIECLRAAHRNGWLAAPLTRK